MKIIWIDGTFGIGKSAVAAAIVKKDVKHVIESLDDVYNYEDEFFKAIDMYEHKE